MNLKKILSLILVLLLTNSLKAGESQAPTKIPNNLNLGIPTKSEPKTKGNTCYSYEQLEQIAERISFADRCEIELRYYKDFADKNYEKCEKIEWYQQPSIIVGGIMLSISLASVLGYLIGSSQ